MNDLRGACRLWRGLASGIVAGALTAASAEAQDAEPRAYTNTPVGLNFLVAGYAYSDGKIAFNPTLPIADARFDAHSAAVAYVRSLDIGGRVQLINIGPGR